MSTRHATSFGFTPSSVLSSSAVIRSVAMGSDIFVEGDRADELIGIVSGRVKLWKSQHDGTAYALIVVGPGELIGTVAVAQGSRNLTCATAMTSVEIICWQASLFRDQLRNSATLQSEFLQLVARRAGQLIDRIEDIASLPLERRLARAIFRLLGVSGVHDDELAVVVEVRQQDLADITLSTVPSISRILSGWNAAGIAFATRGRITVPHLGRLALVADLHLD